MKTNIKSKTLGGQSTVDYQIALSLHASMTSCYYYKFDIAVHGSIEACEVRILQNFKLMHKMRHL